MTTELLTPTDVATLTGHSTKTVANWRVTGASPKFLKAGKRVLYRRTDVDEWLGQPRRSTSDNHEINN